MFFWNLRFNIFLELKLSDYLDTASPSLYWPWHWQGKKFPTILKINSLNIIPMQPFFIETHCCPAKWKTLEPIFPFLYFCHINGTSMHFLIGKTSFRMNYNIYNLKILLRQQEKWNKYFQIFREKPIFQNCEKFY